MKPILISLMTFIALPLLASDPIYYKGTETLPFGGAFPCYVEVTYGDDLNTAEVSAVLVHPHDANNSELVLGPAVATFDGARSIYRFQDTRPAAPVKDLVLNASTPGHAVKFAALFLHGNHHDPIVCDALNVVPAEELPALLEIFGKSL